MANGSLPLGALHHILSPWIDPSPNLCLLTENKDLRMSPVKKEQSNGFLPLDASPPAITLIPLTWPNDHLCRKIPIHFLYFFISSHQVVGGNGTVNTDRKVRLQLFYPYRSTFRNRNPGHLEVRPTRYGMPVVACVLYFQRIGQRELGYFVYFLCR